MAHIRVHNGEVIYDIPIGDLAAENAVDRAAMDLLTLLTQIRDNTAVSVATVSSEDDFLQPATQQISLVGPDGVSDTIQGMVCSKCRQLMEHSELMADDATVKHFYTCSGCGHAFVQERG